ncbi:MAG: glycosyltransferase, partial [Phycisphaerales bacterium]
MFTTHRPPTMVWPGSDKTTEQMHLLDGTTTRQMGIIFYHYSYVLDKQVKQKIELYHRYGWGDKWGIDLLEWYNECFLKWTPVNRCEIDSKYPIWTGDINSLTFPFEGSHPEAMVEYIVKRSVINRNTSAPQLVMQHVIFAINEVKKQFRNEQITALETGTIRSFNENHLSTYYISGTLGNRGRLISVDISTISIKRSKNICYDTTNVEWVHSDSIQHLRKLKDLKFHFVFLDSVNDKDLIFKEFRLVVPMMIEGGILMVDDAGITKDGQAIDESVAAQKGHRVWQFLRACGVHPLLLDTPGGHGTQLKVVMSRENLAKINNGLGEFDTGTKKSVCISETPVHREQIETRYPTRTDDKNSRIQPLASTHPEVMSTFSTDKLPPTSEDKFIRANTENQISCAQALLNQGHIVKAMKEFENFLSLSPENVDARLGRGVCLARLGRLLEAEIEAKNALSKDLKNPGLVQFAEQIKRLKPDLGGDRDIEWGSIKSQIKKIANIQDTGAKLLDFGCGQTAELTRFATQLGYQITAVDMMPLTISLNGLENIHFIQSDFLQQNWTPRNFDLIINCSSIEHAGLAGRYGVVENGPDDDLKIMARMSNIIKSDGKMLLTIPVGLDRIVGSLHRVYGRNRLPQLLDGWEIESSCFWIKDENNQWREVDEESALQREPMLAYGLGCFVLHPVIRITSPSDSTLTPTHGYNPETSDHSEDKTNINTATSKTAIPAISKQPHKVLIVKTDGIGDFVIFSGALPYYRKLYPDSHISIIVRECSTELAEACPYIDEVIVNHRESMVYDQNYAAEFIRRIQAANFDVAICPIYSRDKVSDFITANSGANERIVSSGNDSNMPFEQISSNNSYFTKLIPAKANCMQETERNIEFLKGLGVIIEKPYKTTVWIKQEHKDFADRLLRELNVESPIVICPFAQYQMRDWPTHKWAQLISHFGDYPVLICGSQQDNQASENIIKATEHPRIHNLCGKTSLRQLASLLNRAKLCIGVESAPAHIAAAVDCPHVVLIGGGHFGRFMPYSPKTTLVHNKMDCYGCNWRCKYGSDIRCINTITVEMVEQAANGWLKKAAELPTQDQKAVHKQLEGEQYLVSAIISTYNSEKFIRGCLEDLENQTIADRLEIIVVNSGSQQNEEVIVREFQDRYENIKYIKTEERETIYSAWNRAIKIASGKYITNANTDDRHHKNALEIMARTLDKNPDKVLVYANQLEVKEVNGRKAIVGKRINGEFSKARLIGRECHPGSQPMWRKEVHHAFGYFDENFTIGGDDEFWFRLIQRFDFIYLDEILGERYTGSESLTVHDNSLARALEGLVIHKCYEYSTQEAITIGTTGISEHPVFSNWPEVNIWKQNTKARLENKQTSLRDNIKAKWDLRTNPSPKITIVVVTYNRHKDLLENLYALNEQSEKDFEVIVLDNSGDLSWLKQHTDEFNFGLCGIELEINFGPAPAKNIGTGFSNGQYIIFLDDDAVADRHLVGNIIEHFENHNISGLRGKVLPKSEACSKDVPVNYDLGDQIITTACEVSSLSAFKKDVLIKMGGFDELLFGCEGMELSYRICKAQKEKIKSILYFPDIIIYHNRRPEGPSLTEKTSRQHWMGILVYKREHKILGYKELVQSLYPGYKTLLEINCKNYTWLIHLAFYLHKDFPEEAVPWAEKAVVLKPYGFKGCYILGLLYKYLGRYNEALALLERIYEPLQNLILNSSDEFIDSEFDGQNELSICYLNVCAKLAQLYTQNKQQDEAKQIYTNLLNNPNLTLSQEQKADINRMLLKLKDAKSQSSIQIADEKSILDSITSHRSPLKEQQKVPVRHSSCNKGFITTTFNAGLCNRFYEWTLLRELSDYYKMEILLNWPEIKDGTLDLPNTHYFDFSSASKEFLNSFIPINTSSAHLSHVADLNLNQNNNYILTCGWNYNRKLTDRGKRLNEIRLNPVYQKKIKSFLAQYDNTRIVGLHVRRGDFQITEEFKTSSNTRIPDSWYMDIAGKVLAKYPDTKFFLATDGTDDEKKIFLDNLPIISIRPDNQTPRQDVLELFTLTKLPLVIASVSTFSMIAREYGTHQVQIWPISSNQQIDEQLQQYQSNLTAATENIGLKQHQFRDGRNKHIISAIVSTYNSEKFLRGCLDDLEHQTIADRLEIIVINSGSVENEEAIVREYQQKYDNIVYIKTDQREGTYTAWNRAVKIARGTFLTNANTDDRHRENALEIMAEILLSNSEIALVYGDQICTDTPNGTFANHHAIEMAKRPEYSRERLLFGCCVGSQPMWRKSLHNEFGYFDDTLTCAGDWDFWLRISSKYKFKHIPEFLGLYYHNKEGIEHGKQIHSLYERYIVGKRYGNPYISVIPLYKNENNPLVSVIMPAYNAADYIAEAIESVLIQNYNNFELLIINDGSTDNTEEI